MRVLIIATIILFAVGCTNSKSTHNKEITHKMDNTKEATNDSVPTTEAGWKSKLTPEEYRVLREKGTERAGTGQYDQHWDSGVYVCKGCGTELFTSNTKFDAHCGWPSFYEGIDKSKIKEVLDTSFGMSRTEVQCANCGGHLGHVFNDGPEPTGLRYCINSVSLGFEKKK